MADTAVGGSIDRARRPGRRHARPWGGQGPGAIRRRRHTRHAGVRPSRLTAPRGRRSIRARSDADAQTSVHDPRFARGGQVPMSQSIKVAIVTGAGSGVGKASALALAARGLRGRAVRTPQGDAGDRRQGGGARRAHAGRPHRRGRSRLRPRISSRGRRRRSAASTCSSTTPASARRACRWRTSPTSSGRRWWTPTSRAPSSARRKRSRS